MAAPPAATPLLVRVAALPPPGQAGVAHFHWQDALLTLAVSADLADAVQVGAVVWLEQAAGVVKGLTPVAVPLAGAAWSTGDALRWRRPEAPVSRMAALRLRHRVLRAIRDWFDGQGFLEADTPTLVPAPSPEAQFNPFAAGGGYLITSPEFQLKRLLVGGLERVYRLGPVFRDDEQGHLHNPEFTMLEWYRAGAGAEALPADVAGLLGTLAPLAEAFANEVPGHPRADALRTLAGRLRARPFRVATVASLVRASTGADLTGVTTVDALRQALRDAGRPEADATGDFTAVFSELWVAVEAALPPDPLLVVDWPAPLASLARLNPHDPTVAERVELYVNGVEVANGFGELTDATEQRRRFEADLAARQAQGLPPLPLDESFLDALAEGMPPAAGMALGVDRLVLLLSGLDELRQVLPFAWDER